MAINQILVTGANGFIGHHLSKKLLENNHQVIGLSRSDKPASLEFLRQDSKFKLIQGDITNCNLLTELFKNNEIDTILHLAIAPSSSGNKSNIEFQQTIEFKINFEGTLNLLNVASKAGVKNWIQSSTMSVFNFEKPDYLPVDEKHPVNPNEPYGFTKLLAENACKYFSNIFGFNMIVLRYAGVYGIGKDNGIIANFTQKCLNETIQTFSASTNRTSDFVYVQDVVKANLLALKYISATNNQKNQIFNIGSGEETSIYEAVKLIKNITHSNCKIIEEKSINPRNFYFDCSKASDILNYKPMSVKNGLVNYINDLKTENQNTVILN